MKLNLEPIHDALESYTLLSAEIKRRLVELFAIDEKIITPEEMAVRNELSRLYNQFIADDAIIHPPKLPTTELANILEKSGIFTTRSEAKKAIQNNAVSINKLKISDLNAMPTTADLLHGRFLIIENGKKNKFLIEFYDEENI